MVCNKKNNSPTYDITITDNTHRLIIRSFLYRNDLQLSVFSFFLTLFPYEIDRILFINLRVVDEELIPRFLTTRIITLYIVHDL